MMSKDLKKLKSLKDIAELSLTAELAKLAAIKREEEGPKAKLREIAAARAQRVHHVGTSEGFDMASLMGADSAWYRWAEKEKRQALRDLAQIAERRETQLGKTRTAFGKKDALDRLTERHAGKT
ncbi:hypothetical protein B30_03040 [Celeribacter baekdonensis B30]|uniref:Uncharacterized protein n=2 Tax=Celeribacter baekdonensis TaxID=875171 RepID=K2IW54_9RHOB|nr:hypothetical protein B30_03040 [Celeribacter baekdonensis B30]KAB6714718.1 hypothetical protein C8029_19055 [Roseobacter sp. TSBP12]|tara:strand:- start:18425 stop:18796 length:372 start_codon:yes stop_codon:yes gene_type:complete